MGIAIRCYANVDVGNPEVTRADIGDQHFNITYNVGEMWVKAGCYEALYESNGKRVEEILPVLRKALQHMQDNPKDYIPLNPPNGWGSYEGAMNFLTKVIAEFSKYPKAFVEVSA